MDDLVSRLQAQARAHPSNPVLRQILSDFRYLLNGVQRDSSDVQAKYTALQHNLNVLATEGLWAPSKEDEDSLRELQRKLGLSRRRSRESSEERSTDEERTAHDDMSTREKPLADVPLNGKEHPIIQPPPSSAPLLPVVTPTPTVLPIELVQSLNHTFFLHLLATDPQRVLPPGKSLLSMMSAPGTNLPDGELPRLENQVKDFVHKAFWREAVETLSDPSPAIQLPRLRLLYHDLLASVKTLLPRSHPILATLSLPLSPTSAPLRSALLHLRELLVALRERCSPVRDPYIDRLIRAVHEPNQLASTTELAQLVADTIRQTLELTEVLKEDLSQFVMGSMDEKDLKVMITQQAMLREKSLILRLWPPSPLEASWKSWLAQTDASMFPNFEAVHPPHRRWMFRLVQALGAGAPATCPLPYNRISGTESPPAETLQAVQNVLPPPFFVISHALLLAQNYLQALVITASLRSLVRLPQRSFFPTHSSSDPSTDAEEDSAASFTQRIWTLLKASVDEVPGADDTRIENLADEVVRVRRACADTAHACSPEEEAQMRAAVDRTLQPRDPVYLLLQKRLLQGLAAWLVSDIPATSERDSRDGNFRTSTPGLVHMQTGRERPGKRPRLHVGLENPKSVFVGWERERGRVPAIKGFEDEVLVREVRESFAKVGRAVDWMERVWQDLIETGEVGGPSEKRGQGGEGTVDGTRRAEKEVHEVEKIRSAEESR